ncbi:Ff.00g050400.m01.CDS01 [Fusarium sp. VM40]|nr:Ff.00g050400.m01.CDS01 [Fusarium sp. VM40]
MATRLMPDAFMPSGGYDSLSLNNHLPYHNTSNIPSPPNSYPRAGTLRHQYPQHYLDPCQQHNQDYNQSQFQRGRIPPASTLSFQPNDSSPLSLESLRAAQSVPPNYRPYPQQADSFNTFDVRPATVSPTHGGPPPAPEYRFPASSTAPLPTVSSSSGLAGASLSRSVSADAVAATQSSLHVVQRLVQQNQSIREAWEAERNHLEANRRRVEEVYQEERLIMDEVRDTWEVEKEVMAREIEELKERVHRLEGENSALKAMTAQSIQVTGVVSPLASQRGGSGEGSLDNSYFPAPPGRLTSRAQNPTIPAGISMTDASFLPPGLDGASRRPHFSSSSARVSPTTQPESSPFVPLDPRMQTQNPIAKDFLPSPIEDVATPVPVIDVQEIDPKLEGIPLKATAVQKPTFAASASPSENPTSPVTSPPGPAAQSPEQSRRPLNVRGSSKEYTLQALSAVESRRLTMHAGHTPNHSLSLFPKVNPTDPASIVGEGATPTVESVLNLGTAATEGEPRDTLTVPVQSDRRDSKVSFVSCAEDLDPNALDALMEPSDGDKPLKGPLMLRNMPAKDELFWEEVHKKLEPISQGLNSLPAVMQTDEMESIAGPSSLNIPAVGPKSVGPVGGDGSADAKAETGHSDGEGGGKAIEADVPLKLKSTSNFGAPFGAM